MTRSMLNAYNRAQDNIILGSTTLKMRVVLLIDGIAMECAECNTVAEVKAWARAKQNEWSGLPGFKLSTLAFRME